MKSSPLDLPILAICLDFPLAERGGVSVLVETLAEDLGKYFRIVLVSSDKTLPADSWKGENLIAHVQWNQSLMSRHACRELAEKLAGYGVSVAQFHGGNNSWRHRIFGYTPIADLQRLGIKVFFTNHLTVSIWDGYGRALGGSWFWKGVIFPFAWFGKLYFLSKLELEVAVSNHDLKLLKEFYFPFKQKMRLIYHSRLKEDNWIPSSSREKIILSVGHVAYRKGQRDLAMACGPLLKQFPGWRLLIVGHNADPDYWDEIKKIIDVHGWHDQVELLGARNDSKSLMESASIFVQPSIFEPLGLALQEALYYGCACIGTKVGGIPEMIDDGINGLLVAPGDIGKMSQALGELLGNPSKREEFSRKGRISILAKEMTRQGMAKAYHDLALSVAH